MIDMQQTLWERDETAKYLRVSVRNLDQLVRNRQIPSLKIGRRRLFDPEKIRRWLDQRQNGRND